MYTHALDYLPRVSNTGRAYHGRMLVSFSYCGSVAVMHYKRKLVCTVLVYQRFDGSWDMNMNPTSCTRLKIPAPAETIVCPDHPRIDVIYDAIGGCAVIDVLEGKSMYIEFVYLYI